MADKFKKQRAGRRGHVNSVIAKANEELSKSEPCLEFLQASASQLSNQKQELTQLDETILEAIDETSYESEFSETGEYQIKIDTMLNKISNFAAKSLPSSEPSKAAFGKSTSVKLPYIHLIKFSGNPLDYTKFWELFNTSIHKRTDLDKTSKMHYLITQLEGDAARLLSGFDTTEKAYEEAIELLQEPYGDKKKLIRSRLNAIFEMTSPEPTEESLSSFRANYEGHLRALGTLGCNVTDSGYVFAEILLRKLPPITKDHINRTNKTESWDLSDLRKAISDEIGYLSASKEPLPQQESSNINSYSMSNDSIQTAFPITNSKFSLKCGYCQNSHSSLKCTIYDTVGKRLDRIKELKLCYNCLRRNHSVAKCTNKGKCWTCSKKTSFFNLF